jgi:hypothetical protein
MSAWLTHSAPSLPLHLLPLLLHLLLLPLLLRLHRWLCCAVPWQALGLL